MQKKVENFGAIFDPKILNIIKVENGSMRSKKV